MNHDHDIPGTFNKEKVLDWQLQQLQTNSHEVMPGEMTMYLLQNPEIVAELETIKQFWQPQEELPKPSPALRAKFNNSLAHLIESEGAIERQQTSIIASLKTMLIDLLSPKRFSQLAVLVLVFTLGLLSGRETSPHETMVALQDKVASLSTIMAISMLHHDSASQRLDAVSYTRHADMADPMLLATLIDVFEKEKSSAVKLAIVNAFQRLDGLQALEPQLVKMALREPQPLVQIALTQLLMDSASKETKAEFIRQLESQTMDRDVREFLQLIEAQNQI